MENLPDALHEHQSEKMTKLTFDIVWINPVVRLDLEPMAYRCVIRRPLTIWTIILRTETTKRLFVVFSPQDRVTQYRALEFVRNTAVEHNSLWQKSLFGTNSIDINVDDDRVSNYRWRPPNVIGENHVKRKARTILLFEIISLINDDKFIICHQGQRPARSPIWATSYRYAPSNLVCEGTKTKMISSMSFLTPSM